MSFRVKRQDPESGGIPMDPATDDAFFKALRVKRGQVPDPRPIRKAKGGKVKLGCK